MKANTSRMCSGCGSVKAVLLLSERVYSCPNCGVEINRYVNAARKILRLAQALSSDEVSVEEFGNGVKELTVFCHGAAMRGNSEQYSDSQFHYIIPFFCDVRGFTY